MIKLGHPLGGGEPDLTPDPEPVDGAEPPPIDPKWFEHHAVRAKAELL